MSAEDRIKLFGMSHALVERDLDAVEDELRVELERDTGDEREDEYYPQFGLALRAEASEMGRHYELFYCLEKSIRQLVAETLQTQHGDTWWDTCVPQPVKDDVRDSMKRELDSGMTLRSEFEIDYTTFGQLGEIVRSNWSDFDTLFRSQKAFTKIMTSLNQLRGPIAHCCPLAEDEVVRLRLTVKDWFRLMS